MEKVQPKERRRYRGFHLFCCGSFFLPRVSSMAVGTEKQTLQGFVECMYAQGNWVPRVVVTGDTVVVLL